MCERGCTGMNVQTREGSVSMKHVGGIAMREDFRVFG